MRGSMDSTASTNSVSGSACSSVLRVSKEIENIGERVPVSKKRVTWRFVLAGSEQVHTVMLEHSRLSSKKRLKLDGRRLFSSDQYATNWHYDFHVGDDTLTSFQVSIRDATLSVVDSTRLEAVYDLVADGVQWDQLAERFLPVAHRHQAASVWSSDMYVRRVAETQGVLLSDGDDRPPGTLFTWTFAFGVAGRIHKLELRDLEKGEFVVVLDCRELERVRFEDIHADRWEFDYDLEDHHELDVVVTLVDSDKTYELFIDGSAWRDIGETNFVLEPGWYPVYSRSRSAVYFRHEQTGNTQWEKPLIDRESGHGTRSEHTFAQVSPESQGCTALLHDRTGGARKKSSSPEPESEVGQTASLLGKEPLPSVDEGPEKNEIDLMDFTDVVVQSKPRAFDPFDPTTHLTSAGKEESEHETLPRVDLLSI